MTAVVEFITQREARQVTLIALFVGFAIGLTTTAIIGSATARPYHEQICPEPEPHPELVP